MNAQNPPEMRRDCWRQMASGIAFDLLRPTWEMVRFADVAEGLAKLARFCGATPGVFYSVAQHSVIGAEYLEKRGMRVAARYFLLHDAKEYAIGDWPTPLKRALVEIAGLSRPNYAHQAQYCLADTLNNLQTPIDQAIHEAAGLLYPLDGTLESTIKTVDLMLLKSERLQLMAASERQWDAALDDVPPLPMSGSIRPLAWAQAQVQFTEAFRRLFPEIEM